MYTRTYVLCPVSECMCGVCTSLVVSWFMVRGPLLQKGAFVYTVFLLIFSIPVLVPSVVAQNVWIPCMQNVRCFDLKGLQLSCQCLLLRG